MTVLAIAAATLWGALLGVVFLRWVKRDAQRLAELPRARPPAWAFMVRVAAMASALTLPAGFAGPLVAASLLGFYLARRRGLLEALAS